MLRQLWVYLDEADERALIQRIGDAGPVRMLRGRYFQGSDADLRERPEELASRELRSGERWTHLIPGNLDAHLVAHDLADGPFAGWRRLDEVRSEVLTIIRPEPDVAGLAPGRLQATAHAWFAGEKTRKSAEFTRWMGEAMRLVETTWPETEYEWLRVAPSAQAWAERGGRLHYLFKDVRLATARTAPTTPHHRV